MATQNNPAPFPGASEQSLSSTEDFTIRTMNDDLAGKTSFPSRPAMATPTQQQVAPPSVQNAAPIPSQPPIPPTPRPMEAPVKSPFSQQSSVESVSYGKTAPSPIPGISQLQPEIPRPAMKTAPAPQSVPFQEPSAAPDNKPTQIQGTANETSASNSRLVPMESLVNKGAARGNAKTVYKTAMAVIAVVILAILGAGGYYLWKTNSQVPTPQAPAPIENPQSEQPITLPQPSAEKYSAVQPNYLPLDISTATPATIQSSLQSVASEIGNSSVQTTYAFNIVDSNNNPVDFPIFAASTGMKLPATVLDGLGDNFTLYFFKDGSNVRLALSVELKKMKEELAVRMTNEEKSMVGDLNPLLLGNTPSPQDVSFHNGSYNNYAVRYLNLDKAETLSVDYVLTNDLLIISTSKNTTHAVLDRIMQAKAGGVPSTSSSAGSASSNSSSAQQNATSNDPKNIYLEMRKEIDNVKTFDDYAAIIRKYGSSSQISKLDSMTQQSSSSNNASNDDIMQLMLAMGVFTKSDLITNIQVNTQGANSTLTVSTTDPKLNGTVTMVLENNAWKVEQDSWKKSQ